MKTALLFEDIEWLVEYWSEPAQEETFEQEGFPALTKIESIKFPNGSDTDSYITDKMREDMLQALIIKLEGKAQDSQTERAVDTMMGRQEWDHFFSHGRRMVG